MSASTDPDTSTSRRRMLRAGAMALTLPLLTPLRALAAAPLCVVRPAQTEGPFFIDRRLERSDIRSDPGDGIPRPGVPLSLALRIGHIDGDGCAPLGGAIVDLWQSDAAGAYSGVRDSLAFLRGFQRSDGEGMVRFLTIVPGAYPGRAVHIHFKVRSQLDDGRRHEFTSQLYFDDALIDVVHTDPAYGGRRWRRNAEDGIFRRGGGQDLLLEVRESDDGLAARFELGLVV
ncbi:MAG TPA: hypothetical protein PKZ76_04175 [Xanthomonadaceae bacterium]|nr:hypothetical protein [Xanthomonadaceae bacterium]